jgi:hypothetical protein
MVYTIMLPILAALPAITAPITVAKNTVILGIAVRSDPAPLKLP